MPLFDAADHVFMARALHLAERGLYTTDPNPRVGCVLVRDAEVVGEGWHEVAGQPHAEVHALQAARERARGATAYVTLEPCCHHGRTPPCSQALLRAGVRRVVAAMPDPNPRVAGQGLQELREAGIDVASGLLEAQAEQLNPGFIRRMRDGRPHVRCKVAMSLDGRTAMATGESRWITSEAARRDVHYLRARSSAIVTGIGTVLADDPSLTVRLDELTAERQPLRVVLDPLLRMPPTARMLTLPGHSLVITTSEAMDKRHGLEAAGAEVVVLPHEGEGVDLHALLDCLAERQVNEVLLEAGATLSGAAVRAGIVDELVVYLAPTLMGDAARGAFRIPGLEAMADRLMLRISDVRAVGDDWRITARPGGPAK